MRDATPIPDIAEDVVPHSAGAGARGGQRRLKPSGAVLPPPYVGDKISDEALRYWTPQEDGRGTPARPRFRHSELGPEHSRLRGLFDYDAYNSAIVDIDAVNTKLYGVLTRMPLARKAFLSASSPYAASNDADRRANAEQQANGTRKATPLLLRFPRIKSGALRAAGALVPTFGNAVAGAESRGKDGRDLSAEEGRRIKEAEPLADAIGPGSTPSLATANVSKRLTDAWLREQAPAPGETVLAELDAFTADLNALQAGPATTAVERGDSFWSLARRDLGPGAVDADVAHRARQYMEANPGIDPRALQTGAEIAVPRMNLAVSEGTNGRYQSSDLEYRGYRSAVAAAQRAAEPPTISPSELTRQNNAEAQTMRNRPNLYEFVQRAAVARQLGEEVKDRLSLDNLPTYIRAYESVPLTLRPLLKGPTRNPVGNAYVHAFGAANLARAFGDAETYYGLSRYELGETVFGMMVNNPGTYLRGIPFGTSVQRSQIFGEAATSNTLADLYNNFIGIQIAALADRYEMSESQFEDMIAAALEQGLLAVVPNYATGTAGEGLAGPIILVPNAGRAFNVSGQVRVDAFKAWSEEQGPSLIADLELLYSSRIYNGALAHLKKPNSTSPYGYSERFQQRFSATLPSIPDEALIGRREFPPL